MPERFRLTLANDEMAPWGIAFHASFDETNRLSPLRCRGQFADRVLDREHVPVAHFLTSAAV